MATKKTTKKKNGPRTRRYGCITYRSEPQDNPDCRGRCSPPARMVSEDGRTKVTQIRYRRRNLDVVRKNCACDVKPSSKTKRTAAKKTAKAPVKAVKTVRKAPAKTAAKKTAARTVKAPAVKKAPAKKTAKTVSCGCAVSPAKQSKPKTVTCGCAQTPAQVKKAILDKAGKEGMNRKELDKRIIVATVPRIEPKAPIKAPASWKVPSVGGKFEGKAEPFKAPASWKVPEVGGKFEGKAEPAKKTPAKKATSKKVSAPGSRGVQGRFDAGALKAVAQFVHKMDRDLDMPIFSNDTQFVDTGRIMALRLVSRMPGRSFVGLPLEQSKRDLAVPMDSFIKRLNASVMDVYYQDGRLYYAWKDSPGMSVFTAVHESNNPRRVKFVWSRTATEGDVKFRTSQAMFSKNVLSIVKSSGVKLPKMLTGKTSYKDTPMSMCPPDGSVDWDGGEVGKGCAGYSMYWMNQIAGLVAKAKGSQCIVMFKPNFPLRVVCDLGPYMAELMLAPVVTEVE